LVGSIPVAYAMGHLTMTQLFLVALVSGVVSGSIAPAISAFTPVVVPQQRLADANRLFHVTGGAVNVAGPPVAGFLIRAVSAPFVLALDAASYVISAAMLGGVRVREEPPSTTARRLREDLGEGLAFLWRDRILRATSLCYAGWAFGGAGVVMTLLYLFLSRTVGLSAAWIGLVTAAGGVSVIGVTALSGRLQARFGFGGALLMASSALVVGAVLLPFARRGSDAAVPIAMMSTALGWAGYFLMNVNLLTLRQTITPERMLGRVSAGLQFLVAICLPIGALLSGRLAEGIGIRSTLWIGAGLQVAVPLAVVASPLVRMRSIPMPPNPSRDSADP
jgi:predicted MFS family arabinose efflux permease